MNWAVTYTLNQNRYTAPVNDRISQGDAGARKFERLRDLIKRNASYLVFQKIKDFKAELSSVEQAVLDIPDLDIEVTLKRAQFEALIVDLLQQAEQAVDDTLARAGMRAEEIDVVLRTGGSSLIPAVTSILERRFGSRVVSHDPFTSVAAGLAIANYQGLTFG